MKRSIINRCLILFTTGVFSCVSFADDSAAVSTMAGILSHLNHYPSADEKATLMEIQTDASNSEAVQSIARAMHDMKHSVSAEDKVLLGNIVASDASDDVRELAEVLAGVLHKPSADAKAKLEALQ